MKIKFKSTIPCRAYHIEVDSEAAERHHALMIEFIKRGVKSPRGGGSVPHQKKEGFSEIWFYLHEIVCNEYEHRMKE